MGKAEYGSPKYIAKQMKARGLQRLRWYCQVCEKQCRDENGFKCHTQAPSHQAKLKEKGDRRHVEEYSRQFEVDFLRVLRLSHGTKSVSANRVYNEYIHNKTHIHMTATRWPSLAAFVRHLAATGICSATTVASDGPPDFVLALIDHSAEEQRAKQERLKEERAQASALAADAVLQAQLKAAQEEKESQAALKNREDASEGEAVQTIPEARGRPLHGTPADASTMSAETKPNANLDAKPNAKPAKISFSLARKRQPGPQRAN